jgi:hypothetical protein
VQKDKRYAFIEIVMANKKQETRNGFITKKRNQKMKNPKPYKNHPKLLFSNQTKIQFLLTTQLGSSKNHKLEQDRRSNSSFKTFKNQGSIPTLVLEFC